MKSLLMDAIRLLFFYGWMPFVVLLLADGCHSLASGCSLLAYGYHSLANGCCMKTAIFYFLLYSCSTTDTCDFLFQESPWIWLSSSTKDTRLEEIKRASCIDRRDRTLA